MAKPPFWETELSVWSPLFYLLQVNKTTEGQADLDLFNRILPRSEPLEFCDGYSMGKGCRKTNNTDLAPIALFFPTKQGVLKWEGQAGVISRGAWGSVSKTGA